MLNLTPHGQQVVADIAGRYGVSQQAVEALLVAVNNGGGTQAQFSHPDLGGMGQWSRGGMVMVGDMFNNALKATVDGICTELSNQLAASQMFVPYTPAPMPSGSSQSQYQGSGGSFGTSFSLQGGGGSRWPAELGPPASQGSQNNLHYAVFPQTRRLAIDVNGQVTVYDIGDHQIGGFSQQQGGDQSITFTSQYGTVRVADLPVVPPGGGAAEPSPPANRPAAAAPETPSGPTIADDQPSGVAQSDVFSMIEKLSRLHQQGVLTDAEYETKKAELLARL
ncbi:MAG: SHOCT domain-containing protein [Rhodobacteraceae bacterium]|nr:SHOCT domain-containing protein [Paracoccaceae bacterium]